MKCFNCDKDFAEDAKFCPYCGTKVEDESQTSHIPKEAVEENVIEEEFVAEVAESEPAYTQSPKNKSITDKAKDMFMSYWKKIDLFCKFESIVGAVAVLLLIISILSAKIIPILFSLLQVSGLVIAFLLYKEKIKTDKHWMKYLLIALSIFLMVVNISSYSWKKDNYNNELPAINEEVTQDDYIDLSTPPSEEYIISCLNTIDSISEVVAVTKDNDPNGNLNKEGYYISQVFFSSVHLDQDKIYGKDLIDKGSDAGGSVEVYRTEEDAKARDEYLSGFDGNLLFDSGSHTCIGTVVIRTSKELSDEQQMELESEIIAVLTAGEVEINQTSEKQDKIEFIPLTIENFSFKIPSYWEEDKKTKDSIRYYAETDGKVAMLTIYYGVDNEEHVTWQMLYDDRELMINAIESSMSSMNCKVSEYEEVISNYGEKGLLYKYTLNVNVDNSNLSGEGCWYCIPSEEDNRWFFINYSITENVEYKNYAADFMDLIASAKCNYDSSNKGADAEKSEIVVTMSEDELKGLAISEAQSKLTEMGFSKFEYETLETDKNADLNGKIGAVEIKNWKFGKGDFSKGDTYKPEALVVLWSYVYKEPEKPSPVFYSTNDRDTAKKGNSGVFSYKNKGGSYDIYWIIDFDEGYVYYFTDGNGESSCDRLKIQSGDLNDKVIITYHDGGDTWSYGLHFKYANHPETLIMNDNDGFEYEYSTTDLDDALELRNSKEIINY